MLMRMVEELIDLCRERLARERLARVNTDLAEAMSWPEVSRERPARRSNR
jgi:hypothetical protein